MPGAAIRLSACTASYGQESLSKIIDRLAELGFDGVEITVMYHLPPGQVSAADLRKLRAHLRSAGIVASSLHYIFPPDLSFVSEDRYERDKVARHIGRVTQIAAEVGAGVVMLGGGRIRSVPESVNRATGVQRVVDVLALAAEQAAKNEVTLAFEAINRYETNVGNTLRQARNLIAAVGSPWLGVGADTFHMNIEELNLGTAVQEASDRLCHVQLADSHRLAPGDGHVDFESVLAALDKSGYSGWASFEIFYIAPWLTYLPTYEACDREVKRGLAYIRSIQGRRSEKSVSRAAGT